MVVLREAGKDSFEDNPDKGTFEMDLHRLELPTPFPVGPVNAYLLRGDPLTLVDTGPKTVEAQTALERGVAAAGARLKDIRRILLTHGHTDHAGNAAWVAQRSGAPVHVHEGDRAKVSGRRWVLEHVKTFLTQAGLADSVVESFFEQIQALRQYLDPLAKVSSLTDGEYLPLDTERLRTLYTPGHSNGHVSFYHEDGVLIAGDLLLEGVSPNPLVEFTSDGKRIPTLPQYLQSLRRVLILNCEVAHPGHGGPIANPNARARELITHHEQRKEEIAGMIRRAPKTLAAICGELFPKMDDASLMLALSEVIGHLDLLAEEKRLAIGRKKGLLLYKVK